MKFYIFKWVFHAQKYFPCLAVFSYFARTIATSVEPRLKSGLFRKIEHIVMNLMKNMKKSCHIWHNYFGHPAKNEFIYFYLYFIFCM